MNTIFIGGSRHVTLLPEDIKKRLDNVIASGHEVIVGDANGADKSVQKHFLDSRYKKVTVFCSGAKPRNNLGDWQIRQVDPPKGAKGFQFYAAKDREMAREADFGLMIWDGKSPGTVLNVLRLVQGGKISVLFNVPDKVAINLKSIEQIKGFLSKCSSSLQTDLAKRATPEEWSEIDKKDEQLTFTSSSNRPPKEIASQETVKVLNLALESGDTARIVETLGIIARERGMSQVAEKSGLVRESLYPSLDASGNPEFATVMKVISSIGLQLEVKSQPIQS